jgi:hypothetical protein
MSTGEILAVDIDELKSCASNALGFLCSHARLLASGSTYHVFVLYFAADDNNMNIPEGGIMEHGNWTCIARVAQEIQPIERLLSEIRTMQYIKSRTRIPVPRVYFHNFDPDKKVGAQFMLIERLP